MTDNKKPTAQEAMNEALNLLKALREEEDFVLYTVTHGEERAQLNGVIWCSPAELHHIIKSLYWNNTDVFLKTMVELSLELTSQMSIAPEEEEG